MTEIIVLSPAFAEGQEASRKAFGHTRETSSVLRRVMGIIISAEANRRRAWRNAVKACGKTVKANHAITIEGYAFQHSRHNAQRKAVVPPLKFGKINGPKNPMGTPKSGSEDKQLPAADDGVGHAPADSPTARQLGNGIPTECVPP